MAAGFETRPIDMQPMWLVMYQASAEGVDGIFEAVVAITLLPQRKTGRSGYRTSGGVGYYTPTGAKGNTRQRFDVDEMRFFYHGTYGF